MGQNHLVVSLFGFAQAGINWLTQQVTAIFAPLLGYFIAAGFLSGGLALWLALIPNTTVAYLLELLQTGTLQVLPLLAAYTTSVKCKSSPLLALILAFASLYAQHIPGYAFRHIVAVPQLFSVIVACYVAAQLERWLHNQLAAWMQMFLLQAIALSLMLVLLLYGIIPVVGTLSLWLAAGVQLLFEHVGILSALVIAGSWQIILLKGYHWLIFPLSVNCLLVYGHEPILVAVLPVSFAQWAAVVAMQQRRLLTKEVSQVAWQACVYGVIELAIYQVTLPIKRVFVVTAMMSAVASLSTAWLDVQYYRIGGFGIFSILNTVGTHVDSAVYASLLSVVIAWLGTYLLVRWMPLPANK